MPDFISEDQIKQALVQKLQHLHGFDASDRQRKFPQDPGTLVPAPRAQAR